MVKKPNLILKNSSLTLPPHTFSVQVKSGAGYIKGQWGRVQNKIKETQLQPLAFYYFPLFFIIKFVSLS